jgi:hypothetical protein
VTLKKQAEENIAGKPKLAVRKPEGPKMIFFSKQSQEIPHGPLKCCNRHDSCCYWKEYPKPESGKVWLETLNIHPENLLHLLNTKLDFF